LLEVLSSTATKREAKSYLSRFSLPKLEKSNQTKIRSNNGKVGVNLGTLYHPPRAVDQSPVFTQKNPRDHFVDHASTSLHMALVKIRAPQELNDATLQGVGHTLSQLALLGLSCVVVVDCNDGQKGIAPEDRHLAIAQAGRVVEAIDRFGGQGARRLDNVIGLSPIKGDRSLSVKVRTGLRIAHRQYLLASLHRGAIPVIVPIGFMPGTQTVVPVEANEVVLALCREFAGIQAETLPDESPQVVADKIRKLQTEISLDRIILFDPLGGIPSSNGQYDSHIFINLEQEYYGIKKELLNMKADMTQGPREGDASRSLQSTETMATFWKAGPEATQIDSQISNPTIRPSMTQIHLENLELLKQSLTVLPPSASALLTTAQEVANTGARPQHHSQIPGVGTRRQRNPLIYNLLTDKPVFSSSLPPARSRMLSAASWDLASVPSPATFVKRGMSVTIIPDPLLHPWHPHRQPSSSVQLLDACLDLARLVHLIEDSFSRQLDVPHYISRIKSSLAGIIIAGEYEGGALLTWETPTHKSPRPANKVPYLDKFAVLKRSQGAGGVADIIFNAMVRKCFPGGVCWRSRTDNPVNKWYFERAKGTWKIPGSNWTMFWTTDGVEKGDDTFLDYESVCRNVTPSWADKKAIVD
jgi:amino-acid N-acetyltransferase